MSDGNHDMSVTEERRNRLLELVRQQGFASLPHLACELQVSESTIRRDLDALESSGVARRTHGGAFYTGPNPKLPHFDQRQAAQREKKQTIALAASELIEEGETVLLDGGSTTYEIAQHLVHRQLQVVTNSLPVANLFTSSDAVDLVFIGGYVHARTGVTLGPYANEMLRSLHARHAILSVAGVNDQGFYNSNLLLVETERAMMEAADEVIVVADTTKFGRTSLAHLCDLGAVDRVVVDQEITEDWRSKLVAAGVRLHVTGPSDNTHPTTGTS